MGGKERYYEYVVSELIYNTEFNVIAGDYVDGVYMRFPFCEGWANKRNYLKNDTPFKEFIGDMVEERYALPLDEVTLLYENYYRPYVLEKLLEMENSHLSE